MRPLDIGMNGYSNIAGISKSIPPSVRPNRAERRPSPFAVAGRRFTSSNPSMRPSTRPLSLLPAALSAVVSSSSTRFDSSKLAPTANIKPLSRRCRRRRLRRSGSMRSVVVIRRGPSFMNCDHRTLKTCVVNQTMGNGRSFINTRLRSQNLPAQQALPPQCSSYRVYTFDLYATVARRTVAASSPRRQAAPRRALKNRGRDLYNRQLVGLAFCKCTEAEELLEALQ